MELAPHKKTESSMLEYDAKTHDKPMSVRVYNNNKHRIRRHLCADGDPKAVLLTPGKFHIDASMRAVRDRLDELNRDGKVGYSIQRGYKLVQISDVLSKINEVTFNAQSEIVLRNPDGTYTSFSENVDKSTDRYVFVPSSRVHFELSDDQLLTGHYLLATIIGGPTVIRAQLLRMRNNMCSFEWRKMASLPEELPARRSVALRHLPGFANWVQTQCRLPGANHIDVSIAFGMPYRELTEREMEKIIKGENPTDLLREEVCLNDLINVSEPWQLEPKVFLPTTHKLRDFLQIMVDKGTSFNEEVLELMLVSFYKEMELEYEARFISCETRCKLESHAMLGEFR